MRLAVVAVALLVIAWQSSPRTMAAPPPPPADDDPPTPGEFDSPESPLPDSPPPPEPETPEQQPPTGPSPPRREPTPPRTVVPPQEPSWAASPPPPPPDPPRVINYTATGWTTMLVLGDSTVDPGNNNRLQTVAKANFLPYGMSFLGGRPTGRFSNGRLITDILAEKLGIARSIPGFLDPKLKPGQLRRGVSFASAGSGYDDATAKRSVCQQHNLRFQRRQTNEKLQQEKN